MVLYLSALIILVVFIAIYVTVVLVDIKKAKKRQIKYTFKRALTAFLFLLPATVMAYLFVLLPILFSLGYGFTNYSLKYPNTITWAGFYNFIKAFDPKRNGYLEQAIINTSVFVIVVVPLQISLALMLALFCNQKTAGSTIFKVCFFAPIVISLPITAYLWEMILSEKADGMMNSLLGLFHIAPQDYFSNPVKTMVWIAIISAWQGCGFQMLIFLSGLSGIRKELYEAARMDGCNAIQRFFKVTLPGLKPTMLYILITVFIGACRILIQPKIMIGYHENGVTLSYYMFQEGFKEKNVGYSCAIALMMTVFIGTITLIQRKALGEKK